MRGKLASLLKAIAGVGAAVFLMAPVTRLGALVSVATLFIAIVAGVMGSPLSEDEDQIGYWQIWELQSVAITYSFPP